MNYSVKILAAAGKATLKWRAVTAADLAAIQRLADIQHVSLPERPEVFAEKFELFRDGCLVLVQEGTVVGYCLSHPWLLRDIPPLDTLLRHLPPSPECLFIHDLAIEQRARGKGATGILVEFLVTSHGVKVCHISHSCRSTGPIPFGHGLVSRSCQVRRSLTTSSPTAIRRAT
jgi:hypothetical protein